MLDAGPYPRPWRRTMSHRRSICCIGFAAPPAGGGGHRAPPPPPAPTPRRPPGPGGPPCPPRRSICCIGLAALAACGGGNVPLPQLSTSIAGDTAGLVPRGEYLVRNVSVCGHCHAADPRDPDGPLAGGLAFR